MCHSWNNAKFHANTAEVNFNVISPHMFEVKFIADGETVFASKVGTQGTLTEHGNIQYN